MNADNTRMDAEPLPEEEEQVLEFEPEYHFSDLTLIESDGEYLTCVDIMKKDGATLPWCLRSNLTLIHPFGIASLTLEFRDSGEVYVVDFSPSTEDYVSNYDIRCINVWCENKGWKKPEPTESMVRDNVDFWKHMWQVNSINSAYLDKRYGKRYGDRPEDLNA